jgi:hypothetical protein
VGFQRAGMMFPSQAAGRSAVAGLVGKVGKPCLHNRKGDTDAVRLRAWYGHVLETPYAYMVQQWKAAHERKFGDA